MYNKRLAKIEELTKKFDKNDLNFVVNSTADKTGFSHVEDPITFFNNIKTNKTTIEEPKASQEHFNKHLKTIRRANKTDKQKKTLSNINRLFNERNDSIKFIEGYGSMILEVKRKAAEKPTIGEGLKVLSPKQML